ncbi:MAG: UDP-glucose 6-dehydrogenase, partial [Gammaproteobacteria bacterium]|nr:UDP-glucose 6-dehydrogenase [Gammaproteobacteria bacterium]
HAHFNGDLGGKTIALWGLAFKPNTNDMREASSRVLLQHLWDNDVTVRAYDPGAMDEARRLYGSEKRLVLCNSSQETLKGADALIIVTEWPEFRSPDFKLILNSLSNPVIFDGRNLYDPETMAAFGFTYYSIGRPIASALS